MKSTELRPGMAVRFDGNLFVITFYQHMTPGNLRSFTQLKIKNVATGQTVEKRLRSGEDVERVELDRCEMEYLYTDASGHVFMNTDSFDQTPVSNEMIGELMVYLKPNTKVIMLIFEGRPVSIELPPTVDLKVTETMPQMRGATATNQQKEATLETGLKTRVPPFIEVGETVRVSTADASYQSRA